jgi:uncharacterized protein (PEP-CTERM system associated)
MVTALDRAGILARCMAVGISLFVVVPKCDAQIPAPGAQPDAAQRSTAVPPSSISFSLALDERATDNVSQVDTQRASRAWLTDATAGLSVDWRGAFGRWNTDFRLSRTHAAGDALPSTTNRYLNSSLHMESSNGLWTNDLRATVARLSRSPFAATLPIDSRDPSQDLVETRTLNLLSGLRGSLGPVAVYHARLNWVSSDTEESDSPRTDTASAVVGVRSDPSRTGFAWLCDASTQYFDNEITDQRSSVRGRAGVGFSTGTEFSMSAMGGFERSDVASDDVERSTTRAIGFQWQPTPRTNFGLTYGRRYFGDDYAFAVAHRFTRTAFRVSGSREASLLGTQAGAGAESPLLGLLTDLLSNSVQDPVERAALARSRFENSALAQVSQPSGTVSNVPVLIDRIEATLLALGTRNTLTVTAGYRRQDRLVPDLTMPPAPGVSDRYNQRSINGLWTYRLTPLSTLSYQFLVSRSALLNADDRDSFQRQHTLTLNNRLGPRTTARLVLRRIQISGEVVQAYVENSILAGIESRF